MQFWEFPGGIAEKIETGPSACDFGATGRLPVLRCSFVPVAICLLPSRSVPFIARVSIRED